MKRLLITLFITSSFLFFFNNTHSQSYNWTKTWGHVPWSSISHTFAHDIAVDTEGFSYVLSDGDNQVDSDPSSNTILGPANSAAISKFSPEGDLVWVKFFAPTGGSQGSVLAKKIDLKGNNLVISGVFSGAVDFNTDPIEENFLNGSSSLFVSKIDTSGAFDWTKSFGTGFDYFSLQDIEIDIDNNIYLCGQFQNTINFLGIQTITSNGGNDMFLSKFDSNGNPQWIIGQGGSSGNDDVAKFIATDNNGDIFIGGFFSGSVDFDPSNDSLIINSNTQGVFDSYIQKFSSNGILLDLKIFGGQGNDQINSGDIDEEGNLIICGRFNDTLFFDLDNYLYSNTTNAFVAKLDQNYNSLFLSQFSTPSYPYVRIDENSSVLSGFCFQNNLDVDPSANEVLLSGLGWNCAIVKFDRNGQYKWSNHLKSNSNSCTQTELSSIHTINDKVYLTGVFEGSLNFNSLGSDVQYSATNYSGVHSFSAFISCFDNDLHGVSGSVFNDFNSDCFEDNNENRLEGFNVSIEPIGYIAKTNTEGKWRIDSLPIGVYECIIDTTDINWSSTCPISQTFEVLSVDSYTQGPSFGMINSNPCVKPDVTVFAPFLRRCFSNQKIYVSVCNDITATNLIDSSFIDIKLDPTLIIQSASLIYSDLGNNSYRFEIPDVTPGTCINFNIDVLVDCESLLGQTACIKAVLIPVEDCSLDNIPSPPLPPHIPAGSLAGLPQPCTLPWDQSSISVEGWCQGDSVYFSIKNTGEFGGGDMDCFSPLWMTIDGMVTYTDSIQLTGGQTMIKSFSGTGQTFILNVEQHPLHPGNSHPNAHVEACGNLNNWTSDLVNDFPQNDSDPIVDIYCGVISGSYDPNDKTGYPVGQTEANYIQPNQQLQYVVRFQNTGTDTAFTVVVRDTLDIDLNIFTVIPGVASHPYTFRMYGPRVLEWTFENIDLPDSTTNEEESNGFLTFHVEQVPNLVPGTVIINDADIYFDFNDPITTNTTEHVIYEGFVSVLSVEDLTEEGKDILVYPNPTTNLITIQSENVLNNSFKIFDQNGREVLNGKLNGKSTEVSLGKLFKGMYTLQVDGNYKSAVIIKQ